VLCCRLPLEELMEEDEIDWQATMFQPVGGMDQIPMAFKRKLGV